MVTQRDKMVQSAVPISIKCFLMLPNAKSFTWIAEKPVLIRSTLIHDSPNTWFVSFSFLFFFFFHLEISVRVIHLDLITDCFANVFFLPAQTVFRWLHMLVLVSYRWGWQCCTSSEWIRVGGGDCGGLLCAEHMPLCCWHYPSPCVLFLPRGELIKAAHIIPELVLCLWLKFHTLADKLHQVKCAFKVIWSTFLDNCPSQFIIWAVSYHLSKPWAQLTAAGSSLIDSQGSVFMLRFEGWLASHTVLGRVGKVTVVEFLQLVLALQHQNIRFLQNNAKDDTGGVYFQLIIRNIMISCRISSESQKS